MKNHFERAIDSQFSHLGKDATFHARSNMDPADAKETKKIKIIARRPDGYFDLGEESMHAENPQIEFRVSEVASPSRGDEVHISGKVYRIEEEPRLDLHQLVWITKALPSDYL